MSYVNVPVDMKIGTAMSEASSDGFVISFRLSDGLRVICGSRDSVNAKNGSYIMKELGNRLVTAVCQD